MLKAESFIRPCQNIHAVVRNSKACDGACALSDQLTGVSVQEYFPNAVFCFVFFNHVLIQGANVPQVRLFL